MQNLIPPSKAQNSFTFLHVTAIFLVGGTPRNMCLKSPPLGPIRPQHLHSTRHNSFQKNSNSWKDPSNILCVTFLTFEHSDEKTLPDQETSKQTLTILVTRQRRVTLYNSHDACFTLALLYLYLYVYLYSCTLALLYSSRMRVFLAWRKMAAWRFLAAPRISPTMGFSGGELESPFISS